MATIEFASEIAKRPRGRTIHNLVGKFPREFGAASPRDFKTAKEPGKTIGSDHVLGERRKEKFLIIRIA